MSCFYCFSCYLYSTPMQIAEGLQDLCMLLVCVKVQKGKVVVRLHGVLLLVAVYGSSL